MPLISIKDPVEVRSSVRNVETRIQETACLMEQPDAFVVHKASQIMMLVSAQFYVFTI